MSEEYCDGVKILIKRMESNPEEFKQGNKWSYVLPKESGGFADWGHALTKAELNALSEGIRKIASGTFTDIVMSTLLEDKEEVLRYRATERYAGLSAQSTLNAVIGGSGGGGSGGTGLHPSKYQNAIQPGSWQTVATQTSNTSIVSKLKQKLGIK
jgi:hypothetical protein